MTEKLAETITRLRALRDKATKGPWERCAHLEKNPCGCGGNRGFMFGPGEGDDGHILDMYHEEDRRDADDDNSYLSGQQLPSRERVLANAAFIAALTDHVTLDAVLQAAERGMEWKALCQTAHDPARCPGCRANNCFIAGMIEKLSSPKTEAT